MTSKDDIDVDDKDFDAFLRREGDLAQRLQELPQAGPSAELDAAILAAAKAELEKAGKLSQPRAAAANDPVAGDRPALAPSFIRRWRIPLGLAASLLVTVQLVRLELTDEQTLPNAPAILLERAPAPAAAPAVIQQDKMVAEVRGPALKSASEEKPKKVRSNAPPAELDQAKEADKAGVAHPTAPVASPAPSATLQKPAIESDVAAPAQAPLLAREPAPFSAPAPQPSFAPAPAVAPVENDALKREAGAGSASGRIVTDQRSAAAAAPAPAPMVAAKSASAPNPADDWLAKIDALLKAGSRHEALLEWRKFRNAYPDYAVPEAFKEKMKALDK
ncbi:MAG: hypothetical protein P4L91_02990 [Burkholderiaceae bacterium]|nr:hypothetical protein [Burkholderiaceae bacterium]